MFRLVFIKLRINKKRKYSIFIKLRSFHCLDHSLSEEKNCFQNIILSFWLTSPDLNSGKIYIAIHLLLTGRRSTQVKIIFQNTAGIHLEVYLNIKMFKWRKGTHQRVITNESAEKFWWLFQLRRFLNLEWKNYKTTFYLEYVVGLVLEKVLSAK